MACPVVGLEPVGASVGVESRAPVAGFADLPLNRVTSSFSSSEDWRLLPPFAWASGASLSVYGSPPAEQLVASPSQVFPSYGGSPRSVPPAAWARAAFPSSDEMPPIEPPFARGSRVSPSSCEPPPEAPLARVRSSGGPYGDASDRVDRFQRSPWPTSSAVPPLLARPRRAAGGLAPRTRATSPSSGASGQPPTWPPSSWRRTSSARCTPRGPVTSPKR